MSATETLANPRELTSEETDLVGGAGPLNKQKIIGAAQDGALYGAGIGGLVGGAGGAKLGTLIGAAAGAIIEAVGEMIQ